MHTHIHIHMWIFPFDQAKAKNSKTSRGNSKLVLSCFIIYLSDDITQQSGRKNWTFNHRPQSKKTFEVSKKQIYNFIQLFRNQLVQTNHVKIHYRNFTLRQIFDELKMLKEVRNFKTWNNFLLEKSLMYQSKHDQGL